MWQALATIAVPVLSVLGALLRGGGSRLSKRIGHHAELLDKLKDAPEASQEIQQLLRVEAKRLREREEQRAGRQLNKSNLAAAIFITVVTAAIVYPTVNWLLSTLGTLWMIAPIGVLVLVGPLGIALAAVGFATIYDAPKTDEEKRAERARKAAKKAATRA